jgi:hypothetical protein
VDILTLSALRTLAKGVDPEATVSTRRCAPGSFHVRSTVPWRVIPALVEAGAVHESTDRGAGGKPWLDLVLLTHPDRVTS